MINESLHVTEDFCLTIWLEDRVSCYFENCESKIDSVANNFGLRLRSYSCEKDSLFLKEFSAGARTTISPTSSSMANRSYLSVRS